MGSVNPSLDAAKERLRAFIGKHTIHAVGVGEDALRVYSSKYLSHSLLVELAEAAEPFAVEPIVEHAAHAGDS